MQNSKAHIHEEAEVVKSKMSSDTALYFLTI